MSDKVKINLLPGGGTLFLLWILAVAINAIQPASFPLWVLDLAGIVAWLGWMIILVIVIIMVIILVIIALITIFT